MQQPRGADTALVYAEQGNRLNHVAALSVCQPTSHRGGKVRFKDVPAHFETRLDLRPAFRNRLVEMPLAVR